MLEITCYYCGLLFKRSKSHIRSRNFCSRSCTRAQNKQDSSSSNKENISCSYCGKIITKIKKRYYTESFCDKVCYGLYRQKRVKKICYFCKKEFEIRLCYDKHGKYKFCSVTCSGESRKNYWQRRYTKALYSAKRAGRVWELTKEQYIELMERATCYYCNKMLDIKSGVGLDRKNNTEGYIYSNVVPCCQLCNRIKGDNFSSEEMKFIALLYYNHNNLKEIIKILHLCALRYVNERSSYLTSEFNEMTKRLISWGFSLEHTKQIEGRIFAKDGMGWRYSGLSEEEHDSGLPIKGDGEK